jgi:hypothetical protein
MKKITKITLKSLIVALFFILTASKLSATVTLNLSIGQLKDAGGVNPVPEGTLLVLVADTNQDGFTTITPNSFALNDDVIIATISLDSDTVGIYNLFGVHQQSIILSLSNNLGAGDPLALYWFPTLTISATAPGLGTPYGMYAGDPLWVMPSDGATVDLDFITQFVGGSLPDNLGFANFTVIPEPSTYALIGLGLLGLIFIARRKTQAQV